MNEPLQPTEIPQWIHNAARDIDVWMKQNGHYDWAVGPIRARFPSDPFERKLRIWPEPPPSIESCPRCGSTEVIKRHHAGTFAVPECNFKYCEDCELQWDHT